MNFLKTILGATLLVSGLAAMGAETPQTFDDYNSADPNYERYYDPLTGAPIENLPQLQDREMQLSRSGCYRVQCAVYVDLSMNEQRAHIYVNGQEYATWPVSTGLYHPTKKWDGHPTNRIYYRYDSRTYPEGDYNGLGNMPYAIFYYGGFAIHGTPKGNWSKLGHRASHGCIRLLPANALKLNRLVRAYGSQNTWFFIHD
jgi:hypothetical protein